MKVSKGFGRVSKRFGAKNNAGTPCRTHPAGQNCRLALQIAAGYTILKKNDTNGGHLYGIYR